MDFKLSQRDLIKTNMVVESFNKSLLKNGREIQHELGKDDFLKLLITQLKNQDPTKPMEDKKFIAQLAQFSSLEQMTQMNETITSMNKGFIVNQALSLLGTNVTVNTEDGIVTGKVEEVLFNNSIPSVKVDGNIYPATYIVKVANGENQ